MSIASGVVNSPRGGPPSWRFASLAILALSLAFVWGAAGIIDRARDRRAGGLALARCLCAQPKLVLLDEPTEGIQPSIIDEIAELLHAQRHKRGLAIVLVEQNLEFIRRLSDRVLIIQKGRITGQLAPDDLGDEDLVAEFVGMSR